MKRTSLTAMLTILAVLASTFVVAACGSKSGSSSSKSTSTPTSTTSHKQKSKPAY